MKSKTKEKKAMLKRQAEIRKVIKWVFKLTISVSHVVSLFLLKITFVLFRSVQKTGGGRSNASQLTAIDEAVLDAVGTSRQFSGEDNYVETCFDSAKASSVTTMKSVGIGSASTPVASQSGRNIHNVRPATTPPTARLMPTKVVSAEELRAASSSASAPPTTTRKGANVAKPPQRADVLTLQRQALESQIEANHLLISLAGEMRVTCEALNVACLQAQAVMQAYYPVHSEYAAEVVDQEASE